jgi:RND family efflux transporter MFP subunit
MRFIPLVSFLLFFSCAHPPAEHSSAQQPAAIPVQTVAASPQEWPRIYEATGTVTARTTATISARTTGYILKMTVQPGDRFREGDVLATIDSRDLEISVKRASVARETLRLSLPEADAAISASQAHLDLSQTTFTRINGLFDKRSVSSQEFDEASAKLKDAKAELELSKARRLRIDSQIAEADQQLRASELERSYTEIRAPFNGTVISKAADTGSLATPGAPLLTIEREGAYRFDAAVEESRLSTTRIGQKVTVILDTVDHPVEAHVSELIPQVDPGSRTFTARIDLPAIPNLHSGVFGRARFPLGNREVLTIPGAAVIERGQLQTVFVSENGYARSRALSIGERLNGNVEALSGIHPGDLVIAPVPPGLSDGARIEVRP